ncbi:MAG: aromatic ring-hydroxylating dioxygenase subunit alpha [Saprospiraceae bacterium]|nr:aromatic ring-hydroxylating dioxygenase subunit alpha [Saprospiraceae bacterium]
MQIDKDIRWASTLPGYFYRDKTIFEEVKEKIFAASWLYVADADVVENPGDAYPFTLLEGVLDEPLVLVRDREGVLRCLSNVCTHRGKVIVEQPGNAGLMLRCCYHGRCFRLDGSFKSMPEFGQAEDFPTPADDLTQVPVQEWLGMVFVSLKPAFDFEEATRPIRERIDFLPMDTLRFDPEGTQDYHVQANWALYCDNFLEGFHIPFVHPALNEALDFKQYDYELFRYCNLQIGIADEGQPHFDLPPGQPDFGKKIYAWYFWLFPNLMLNFYPWGLSLNIIEPLSHERTRVRFRSYRFEGQPFNRSVNQLEKTELEDEAVVESVQRGIQSRFYQQGRFSPTMEKGVHHFHGLVANFLK